jgi:3-(methylthio)propanoyl-CoA dehydrogenase
MYQPPLRDLQFVIHELLGDDTLTRLYSEVDYTGELADSILEEAGKFGTSVLEPLNKSGDQEGARWDNGVVRVPAGYREAYKAYAEGGWTQLSIAPSMGGQGMPQLVNFAAEEIFFASNMAFYLGTSLARGAVEAIEASGSSGGLVAQALEKLASGEWMGTMNLTEPQAGSDLNLLRTRAAPEGDHYRIFGQKIFITYGDHDMTDNIVHLVLARIDGAPEGTKGISMFLVPKFMPNADGTPGAANDLRCLSIEHKLGIHGSPTCVMAFGEKQGAIGYLMGAPNSGLQHMFVMMNAARLSVGVQGVAQSERALQLAREWARNRVQGRLAGGSSKAAVPIIQHADVKRMLLSMKARTEAMRALALFAAEALDEAHRESDEPLRQAALLRAELLTPIVKGWCTETALQVTSTGMQVHGGMGYVEETGAAQFFRDVRITSIYEGTTTIQANDLIGRKLGRDDGATLHALVEELALPLIGAQAEPDVVAALGLLKDATRDVLDQQDASVAAAQGVAVPYLELCGVVLGGALMAHSGIVARQALDAGAADAAFYQAKLATVRFYIDQVLPTALGLARIVQNGADAVTATDVSLL